MTTKEFEKLRQDLIQSQALENNYEYCLAHFIKDHHKKAILTIQSLLEDLYIYHDVKFEDLVKFVNKEKEQNEN